MTEEEIMMYQNDMVDEDGYIYVYPNIPYFLIDKQNKSTKRYRRYSLIADKYN